MPHANYPPGYEGWGFRLDDCAASVRGLVATLADLRLRAVPAMASSPAALRLVLDQLRALEPDVDALGAGLRALLIRAENALGGPK